MWVSLENIEDRADPHVVGMTEMVSSGQSVGSVVSSTSTNPDPKDTSHGVQLQRIISRCKAQFFYASYGEVENNSLPEVPLPVSSDFASNHSFMFHWL